MILVHSPAKIMARWLIVNGHGVAPSGPPPGPDWQVTSPMLPDDLPDNRISVAGTGAVLQGMEHRTKEAVEKHNIQIRIRGKTDDIAHAKGATIQEAIRQIVWQEVIIGSNVYIVEAAVVYSPLAWIGQEEQNKRNSYTINLRATIRSNP